MIETISHLKLAGLSVPICIGVHGIFADQAYDDLLSAGAERVVTTNSITHLSNTIVLTQSIASVIQRLPIVMDS